MFASAASAAPVWRIDTIADTVAAPGATLDYAIVVTNVGDQENDGSDYVITATLPSGMVGNSVTVNDDGWSCDDPPGVAGQNVITCRRSGDVRVPHSSVGESQAVLLLTVDVDPGASGVLTSTFDVSGGGATSPSGAACGAPEPPCASTADPTRIVAGASPTFGVDAFDGEVVANPFGAPFTQAGGHPYAASTTIDFNKFTHPVQGGGWPVETTKDIFVDLPPGFVGFPTAVEQCSLGELANSENSLAKPFCPSGSQIGVVRLTSNFGYPASGSTVFTPVPVYNLVPPTGVPARFGFNVGGTVVTLDLALRSASDYGLSVNVRNASQGLAISGTELTVWGAPADPSHDIERACPGAGYPDWFDAPSCTAGLPIKAFLRNPTACTPDGVGLETSLRTASWVDPGDFKSASFVSHDPPGFPLPSSEWGDPQGPTGCDQVPFEADMDVRPTVRTPDSPTGLDVTLSIPQPTDPDVVGSSDLRKAVVKLPEGMSVNASSADGLGACTPAQIGLGSDAAPTCPSSSKIGTVEVETPALEETLDGAVYLASQDDNPFASMLAMYIVVSSEERGVTVKLAGRVDPDPVTGQLTTTFDNQPQLPFSKLELHLKSGPRAPLSTPATCGTYATSFELTPWSEAASTVSGSVPFTIDQGCGANGFSPSWTAGSLIPAAGAFSPFLVNFSRTAGEQEFKDLTVTMPKGVLAKLKGVALCPEANAAAGTCDAASRIGSATAGAGSGANLFYLHDQPVYLTGPYKGAPYGLSVAVRAIAGPIDLGTIVVRQAIQVDPTDGHLTVVSDPLPRIVKGIVLNVRDVRVDIDRPRFTINPTSCSQKQIEATIHSYQGATAQVGQRFQASDCRALGFKPRMTMRLIGKKQRRTGRHPGLAVSLTQGGGQANIRAVKVRLPLSLALDPANANGLCGYDEGQKVHGGPVGCPKSSIIGKATAITPVLNKPLTGRVYFVENRRRTKQGNLVRTLPVLLVALRGEVAIDLRAQSSVSSRGLVSSFPTLPDAPVTRFNLRLKGGNGGILVVTRNARRTFDICRGKQTANVETDAQNGRRADYPVRMKAPCRKASKAKRRG
jgi:uncharacterized repeat protein (TIGR01451 family)